MKYVLKAYRFLLLILFSVLMVIAAIALHNFYKFIHPITYVTQSLGEVVKVGKLGVTVTSSIDEPVGFILISPSGKEYRQSSRDVEYCTKGNESTMYVITADFGEWYIKYRAVDNIDVSIKRLFEETEAAVLVSTKATVDKTDRSRYIISMSMSSKNYKYTVKAVRRKDGFSLTSSGDGGKSLLLEPYNYTGVWDFYLNTIRSGVEYNTSFSYIFDD